MVHEPELTFESGSGSRDSVYLDGYQVGWRYADGTVVETCRRCGGCGQYSFNLLDGTVCYGCNGSGRGKTTTEADILRRAKNRAKAAERRAALATAKLAEQQAAMETWRAEHPVLMQTLNDYREAEDVGPAGVLRDLAEQTDYRPLSEAQMHLVEKLVAQLVQRTVEKEAAQAAGHFGEVGQRVTVEVEIVAKRYFASDRWDRQSQNLVTMRTAEGQVLKTWTSGLWSFDVEPGQHLTVKATVKSHGEYNDRPETTVTRVVPVTE